MSVKRNISSKFDIENDLLDYRSRFTVNGLYHFKYSKKLNKIIEALLITKV